MIRSNMLGNRFNFAADTGSMGGNGAIPPNSPTPPAPVVVDDEFASPFGDTVQVLDAEPQVGPSRDELEKLLATQKTELEDIKSRQSAETSSQSSFSALADSITKLAQRPVQVQTQAPAPGESYESYKSRIETQFIEKPVESIQEVVNRATGPAFEALASQTAKLAKRTAMLDSGDSTFWKKHAEEIDALSATFAPQERLDPESYSRAYDIVRGRHVDELLASMKDAETKGITPQKGSTQGNPSTPNAPSPSATSSSPLAGGSASQDGKIHITRSDAERVKDYMLQQCIPDSQFERVVSYFRTQGVLKSY